jgi:hypothetical protein
MDCFTPTYPFGPYQRFMKGGRQVFLNYTDNKFAPGPGDAWLERYGYDREPDPEYQVSMVYNYVGASQFDGPPHRAPYLFRWRLQNISAADFRDFNAMHLLYLNRGEPTRLWDGRMVLEEVKPRVRARFDPGITYALPNDPDIDHFFGIFNIGITKLRVLGKGRNGYRLEMEAMEHDPDLPVPISEDVP